MMFAKSHLIHRRPSLLALAALWLISLLPLHAAEPTALNAASYGAAGEVSGSLHLLDTGNGRWLIDCGAELETKNAGSNLAQSLPAGIESVNAVFLTHAHVDHLGRLPLLVERGFAGPIYASPATAALAVPMLRAEISCNRSQPRHWTWSKDRLTRSEATGKPLWVHWRGCKYRKEIDAAKLADADCSLQELVKRFADGTPPVKVVACAECIKDEIDAVMHLVKPLKCDTPVEVAEGVRAKLLDAGHIPGSASVLFEVALNGPRRVLFSGDLGNTLSPLSSGPHAAPACDAVFIESTYGPAHRDPSVKEHRQLFRRAVAEAVRRGGVVWIPCFSLDRTQKILYELHLAQQERLLPNELPIYCPSPTAREVTSLYKAHRRDGWFTPAIAADPLAFQPAEVRTTIPSARRLPHPCIIISTSDILLTEWMRRLLTDLLPDPSTAVLLVSYQDPESAGGLLKKGARKLEIGGQSAPVRANVQSFQCFTGHGDAVDIDRWLAAVPQAATVVLVHGDKEELGARADQLREQGRRRVIIAERGKTIDLLRASSERTLAPPVTP